MPESNQQSHLEHLFLTDAGAKPRFADASDKDHERLLLREDGERNDQASRESNTSPASPWVLVDVTNEQRQRIAAMNLEPGATSSFYGATEIFTYEANTSQLPAFIINELDDVEIPTDTPVGQRINNLVMFARKQCFDERESPLHQQACTLANQLLIATMIDQESEVGNKSEVHPIALKLEKVVASIRGRLNPKRSLETLLAQA